MSNAPSVLASLFLRPLIAVLGLVLLGAPGGSLTLATPADVQALLEQQAMAADGQ